MHRANRGIFPSLINSSVKNIYIFLYLSAPVALWAVRWHTAPLRYGHPVFKSWLEDLSRSCPLSLSVPLCFLSALILSNHNKGQNIFFIIYLYICTDWKREICAQLHMRVRGGKSSSGDIIVCSIWNVTIFGMLQYHRALRFLSRVFRMDV